MTLHKLARGACSIGAAGEPHTRGSSLEWTTSQPAASRGNMGYIIYSPEFWCCWRKQPEHWGRVRLSLSLFGDSKVHQRMSPAMCLYAVYRGSLGLHANSQGPTCGICTHTHTHAHRYRQRESERENAHPSVCTRSAPSAGALPGGWMANNYRVSLYSLF